MLIKQRGTRELRARGTICHPYYLSRSMLWSSSDARSRFVWNTAAAMAAWYFALAVAWVKPVARDIDAGDYHTCTLRHDKRVRCWGRNTDGQASGYMVDPGSKERFALLACGGYHTCMTHRSTNLPVCMGDNLAGQATPPRTALKALSLGLYHSCGLRVDDGSPVCWGRRRHGQSSPPPGEHRFFAIAAGGEHTCALQGREEEGGVARCWGDDGFGQLMVPHNGTARYSRLASGAYHTCAIQTASRTVECWGDGRAGQATVPAELLEARFAGISAGRYHTCGRLELTGQTHCWGRNKEGQASPPDPTTRFSKITAGGDHSCGIRAADGIAVCWGYNLDGESATRFAFDEVGA